MLDLFLGLIEVHGLPSRVRGDHGVENLLVAAYMGEVRGEGRGSYIWGRSVVYGPSPSYQMLNLFIFRSVHNVRIERLWCDLTTGFGSKWKSFFQGLEVNDGLDTDIDDHLWLLHHLFLPCINNDALEWAEAWNNHTIALHGERQRSPKDMFVFGMIEEGPRGLPTLREPVDEDVDDLASYGVDWDAIDNRRIMEHHNQQRNRLDSGHNPFVTHQPERFTEVLVPEANCPLTINELHWLDGQLEALPYFRSESMDARRLLWVAALDICRQMFESN